MRKAANKDHGLMYGKEALFSYRGKAVKEENHFFFFFFQLKNKLCLFLASLCILDLELD